MELREYAQGIVSSASLQTKRTPPPTELTDDHPGEPLVLSEPGRPYSLRIRPATEVKVPSVKGFRDVHQRPRILHALANHEFQAIELFAWALLAFPNAPRQWRRGLVAILAEEQRHFNLYVERLEENGCTFGDYGVTGYFWNRADALKSPIHFSCVMGLTFEGANLDFAAEYAQAARDAGDSKTAKAIDVVHRDEIRHVAFGWHWLKEWKSPEKTMWDAYNDHLTMPINPRRSRGHRLDADARRKAGFDEHFLTHLDALIPQAPGNSVRR